MVCSEYGLGPAHELKLILLMAAISTKVSARSGHCILDSLTTTYSTRPHLTKTGSGQYHYSDILILLRGIPKLLRHFAHTTLSSPLDTLDLSTVTK